MPKQSDLSGQTFGVWKVVCKTSQRNEFGNVLYKCINLKDKKVYYKNSSYLTQYKKRGSFKTSSGRRRKWIIIKKPYIEEKEA